MARADERRGRLVGLEERRAVERDRAARVSADLRVRDDAIGIEPGLAGRELQLVLRQAHEHERRPQRLRVRALGEGRVEHLLFDVHGAVGPAVLVDEAAAAAPRRRVEASHVDRGAERRDRDEDRRGERAPRGQQPELEEPAPAEAAVGDELGDGYLLVDVLLGRVVVLELFVRDQPLRGDD